MTGLCVIVGAGAGVSLGVAKRFAQEGFEIALLARRAAALAEQVAALTSSGAWASGYVADASTPTSLQQAFDQIKAEIGPPTVLVYNAAAIRQGAPAGLPVDDLMADLMVNVGGALVAAQQVIPAMRSAGQGTILFTGGGLALNPNARYASLAIGKAAMRNLALTLAQELAATGIHVATVTIDGFVKPGTHFDPDQIAETFWTLHRQAREQWQPEIVYK